MGLPVVAYGCDGVLDLVVPGETGELVDLYDRDTLTTAVAVVFLCGAVRDYLKEEGKMTIARRIWLRMALIFAGVGIGLYLFQALFW